MFRQIVRVRMPQCSSYIWAKVTRRKAYSVIFFSVDCTYKNDPFSRFVSEHPYVPKI